MCLEQDMMKSWGVEAMLMIGGGGGKRVHVISILIRMKFT